MISFPNAKINLGLNIVNKRDDGYHNIESCFYPIPWYDSLEVIKSESFSFHSYGLEIPGDESSNLCVKAYDLIKADHNIDPVEIHLLKNIPMGAGLGGGSADGAFALKMLNDLFDLGLSQEKLEHYALQLGSDCPFFIKNQPAIASGRGEILELCELDLTGYHLAIYNPKIHVSTSEAYAGISPKIPTLSISDLLKEEPGAWKDTLINDFEESIFPNHQRIADVKKDMYQAGAIYSSMTGSGSTVFGLFSNKIDKWKQFSL
ncbi:MAG: 4-(cytidine 5'-diphospho)-2-C-methyl-D-erythritol kinase [Ekhidna sp.]|nr:4-(cytidine 5'-diphospho)-2-C-methyl-D-erythritol kinase [Ekhidna sp.]